jgi:hypothetical protein
MASDISSMGAAIYWIFGGFVVVLYALDRFETPIPARGTTTFIRYWGARIGYLVSMLGLYLLLAGAVTDAKPILQMIIPEEVIGESQKALPGPLLSALLLTSLLPHISHLKRIDEAVKQWFQRLGNIPMEIRALSGQLKNTRIVISPELMAKLHDTLEELGVKEEWISTRENTFRHKWARVAALCASVHQWNTTPPCIRYMDIHRSAFDEISRRVKAVGEMDENALAVLNQDMGWLHPWRKHMSEELGTLHQALCDFIARGVLQEARSPKQRYELLAGLGFEAGPRPMQHLNAHDIFLVGGVIFLMMLFTSLIVNQGIWSTDLSKNISMRALFMVPIIYCVAIVAAIYPKAFWSFADIRTVGHRPVAGYAVSGLFAMAATFVIQLLFRYMQEGFSPGSFMIALKTNVDRWPWLLMNFLMTIAIAWAADNHALSREKEPRWLRTSETLGLACTCGLLQWITLELLHTYSKNPGRWHGRTGQMIFTSALVGAVIGFFVPHFYRARGRTEALLSRERPVARSGPIAPWAHAEADKT